MEVVSDSIFLMASAFLSRRICSSAESSGACNTFHCSSPNMDKEILQKYGEKVFSHNIASQ
jgi:hypothetical protein